MPFRRRPTLSPLGCTLLAGLWAALVFGVAVLDLVVPGLDYPPPGERTAVSYRVPSVGVLLELDERSLYSRGRVEVPLGSRVVDWPSGGRGHRTARFELPAGSAVGHRDLSFLRALEEGRRPPGLSFSLGLALLLLPLALLSAHGVRLLVPGGRLLRVHLVLLGTVLLWLVVAKAVMLLSSWSVFWLPLAGISMAWALADTRRGALAVGAVGAAATPLLLPVDWALGLALAAQALVPPLLLSPVRKRRSVRLAWIGGGVAALLVYVGYHLLLQGGLPPGDLAHWRQSGLAGVVGAAVLAPLVALLLRPVLALALGEVSRGRLMALTDLDHPLLQQIAGEAQGTWQHTLAVANLAEVVCRAVGADGTLVRAGAYFHDAGKSLNPSYFAENLTSGEASPHEGLRPEASASVILEHVVEGERLAREHGLPRAVREFIYTHHGDDLLAFFWHRCLEEGNPRDLPEETFHYSGIPPQTRETAILSLVDAVEAASHTLREPDTAAIDELVRQILFGKLERGQLHEAGLSAADLATISVTLQETLRSQFHARPKYPWQEKEGDGAPASVTPADSVAAALADPALVDPALADPAIPSPEGGSSKALSATPGAPVGPTPPKA